MCGLAEGMGESGEWVAALLPAPFKGPENAGIERFLSPAIGCCEGKFDFTATGKHLINESEKVCKPAHEAGKDMS